MTFDSRAAEVDNDWRHLREKSFSSRLDELAYRRLSCLDDGSLSLKGGLNAIVGGNGVGKSAVVAAVAELFNEKQLATQKTRTGGSELAASVQVRGKTLHLKLRGDGENRIRDVPLEMPASFFGWIDPSFTPKLVSVIHEDARFAEVLEGFTPHRLTPDELLEICYLVKKPYEACDMYEVEDYRNLEPFPYFTVTVGASTYSSEAMGLGELSLLHHFWLLRRLGKNSVLVLEEPETYVSPRSQTALMNVLAKRIKSQGIWTIVTTHSPTILRQIPECNIHLLTQLAGRSHFVHRTSRRQIEDLLGEGSRSRAHLIVEDDGARALLQGIIALHGSDLISEVQVVPAGDETKVSQIVSVLPKLGKSVKLICVLDGNLRDVRTNTNGNWPLCFLPGERDPDSMMQEMMQSTQSRIAFAQRLGKDLDDVAVACDALVGENYHNFPIELTKHLDSDIFSVRRHLVETWLDIEANATAARTLVMTIRGALVVT